MTTNTRRTRLIQLHKAFGHPILDKPTVPPDDRVRLRVELVVEETLELVVACFEHCADGRFAQIRDNLREIVKHYPVNVDLPLAADALEDIQVVCEGFNLEMGIDSGPISAEVHRTNMAKVGGPVRADGKREKPPGWVPPNIAALLEEQRERALALKVSADVPIVMTTFNRQPPHVHDTLTSLFERDPSVKSVTLIVSESNADFLGPWATDERVVVQCLPAAMLDQLRRRPAKARTAICTREALRVASGPVIVLQDDLQFADRWYERTLEIVETIPNELERSRSMVALYSPHEHRHQPISEYTKKDFYGNQAIYFGDVVRRHCIWALGQSDTLPDDVAIRLAMERDSVLHLYALVPSLVQHVGKVTTVESGWFHTSPTYQEPVADEKG
jgi:predicted HAD superfamily Cof-like phosphohydrolase